MKEYLMSFLLGFGSTILIAVVFFVFLAIYTYFKYGALTYYRKSGRKPTVLTVGVSKQQ